MEYLKETTKQKSQSHIQEKDEHEQFFDSLLSVVRQFDEDQSLTFRAEVIKVIQKNKTYINNQDHISAMNYLAITSPPKTLIYHLVHLLLLHHLRRLKFSTK